MAQVPVFEKTLYMVIDITTPESTRLLKVTDLRCAGLLGLIYKHQGLKVIAPPIEGRGFSKIDLLGLQYFYWNLFEVTPPDDYSELVQHCLEKLKQIGKSVDTNDSLMAEIRRLGIDVDDPTATKKEPVEKDLNALPTAPKVGSSTGKVWELADAEFIKAGNQMPDRKAVIAACEAEGINPSTAATQYAKWAKAKRGSSI